MKGSMASACAPSCARLIGGISFTISMNLTKSCGHFTLSETRFKGASQHQQPFRSRGEARQRAQL